MTVAVRIENEKTAEILANVVGQVGLVPDYAFTGSEVVDASFPVGPLVFQSAGVYTVKIMISGEKIKDRPLPVNPINFIPPPNPSPTKQ